MSKDFYSHVWLIGRHLGIEFISSTESLNGYRKSKPEVPRGCEIPTQE